MKLPEFIAVDGESFTAKDGDHRYVLLAASTGDYQFRATGLSTLNCFEFLLSLPPKTVKVGFGWNYDVNMILGDLDTESLVKLWREGEVTWNGYLLEWIPGKIFTVKSRRRKVTIYDVFGFFQSSFVKALEKWGFEPPAEIETMKQARDRFDADLQQRVIRYCLLECELLVRLCNSLAEALQSVELSVKSWIGAGAIAASLLAKEGIDDHHVLDSTFPDSCLSPIMTAYFGGRVELFQQGAFPKMYNYDVSSAYPSEAYRLPSLAGCQWTHVTSYKPDASYALWRCRWNISDQEPVMPFPYRYKGQIYYPRRGEGWYHAVEVQAAQALVEGIEVLEGWLLQPATAVYPFDFVPRIYAERAKLKLAGHAGEKVLKLGLNSLYGKLAQGVGHNDKPPPYQSFLWAGMITAGTRAKLLQLAALDKEALVMVATDGLFFTRAIDVDTTGGLGGLDFTELGETFIAQPGVYHTCPLNGKPFGKSRGFFTKEIDFQKLKEGFIADGPYHISKFPSRRFNGLGNLMVTGRRDQWRRWTDRKRKLSLYPSRKFISPGQPLQATMRHVPPEHVSDTLSEPYTVKRAFGEMTIEELEHYMSFIQGHEQPLRG